MQTYKQDWTKELIRREKWGIWAIFIWSFRFFLGRDLENTINEIFAELFKAELVDDLLSAFSQLDFIPRNDLEHVISPVLSCFTEVSTPLTHWFSRASAVVGNDGHAWVHGFTGHDSKVLIFRSVEDALGVPEQVLASFIVDGSIEVNMLCDIEFFGQILQLSLMLDVLGHLEVIPTSNHQLYPVFAWF